MDKYPCNFGLAPKPERHETALKAWGHQFKGRCNNCGKYGHKGQHCPKKRQTKAHPGYKCFLCGEKGHYERDCPKRKEYEEKGFLKKDHGEKGFLAHSKSDSKYGCKSLDELGF